MPTLLLCPVFYTPVAVLCQRPTQLHSARNTLSNWWLMTAAGFSIATAQQIGNIVLIDGSRLTKLMMKVGIGVTTRRTVPIYRLNSEYFEEL